MSVHFGQIFQVNRSHPLSSQFSKNVEKKHDNALYDYYGGDNYYLFTGESADAYRWQVVAKKEDPKAFIAERGVDDHIELNDFDTVAIIEEARAKEKEDPSAHQDALGLLAAYQATFLPIQELEKSGEESGYKDFKLEGTEPPGAKEIKRPKSRKRGGPRKGGYRKK